MILKSLLLFSLLVLTLTYDIKLGCGTTNCPDGCNQCTIADGGPFQNNSTCVDQIGGCSIVYTQTIFIGCESGCGQDCSYKSTVLGQSSSGCINDNDQVWPTLKQSLDTLYAQYVDSKNTYNWCTETCGLSTGILVAIILGGVAVVGIAIVVIVKCMKKKKVQGYQKM